MIYVLDTNIFIAGLNGNATVLRRLDALNPELRRRGALKADFDLSIAAIAFDLEATLVSDDRAFHDDPIPNLEVENWLMG